MLSSRTKQPQAEAPPPPPIAAPPADLPPMPIAPSEMTQLQHAMTEASRLRNDLKGAMEEIDRVKALLLEKDNKIQDLQGRNMVLENELEGARAQLGMSQPETDNALRYILGYHAAMHKTIIAGVEVTFHHVEGKGWHSEPVTRRVAEAVIDRVPGFSIVEELQ